MTREERFDASFEQHYRAVVRFVRTRGHEPAEADDLVSGTFEIAWRKLDELPDGHEALPWLLGVARNLSRNARRKTMRETAVVDSLSSTTRPWTALPLEERAAGAEVMRALAQLKPLDRDLILLVAWDELTPSEAGRVLGLLPVTARSRLHRARQRLSALLEGSAASAVSASPSTAISCEGRRS